MHEHARPTTTASATIALEVVHPELLRHVLALHGPRLHAVELDRAAGQVRARDARPEAAEQHALDEPRVRAVRVEGGVSGFGVGGHEAEGGEGGEEVVPEGGDVPDCGWRDEVLRQAAQGWVSVPRAGWENGGTGRTCSQKARMALWEAPSVRIWSTASYAFTSVRRSLFAVLNRARA